MQFSTARSEHITAILSTAVAVLILAGGVTAYQSHHAPVDDVVQLESDLRYQLEVAFRHDPNERIARLAELENVSLAWQQSSRSPAGRKKLASWLLETTIRSMPGSIEPLPAVPNFGEQQQKQQQQQDPTELRPDGLVAPPAVEKNPEGVSLVPTPAGFDPSANVDVQNRELIETPFVATDGVSPLVAMAGTVVDPVRINLTELAARVAGYHAGLVEVETVLLTLEADDLAALADQVRQLDEMTRDFHFVQLYYEALTDRERRTIAMPRPMTATLAEIERRLDRSQAGLSNDFLREFDAGHQDQFARLRSQLAEVARRVQR